MSGISVLRLTVIACAWVGLTWGQQTPAAAWQADAEALRKRPGLVRFYSFMNGDGVQSNRAGSAEAMTFKADNRSALTTEAGRVAGKAAVVLDGEAFEAPQLTLSSNAFSVSVWLRPLAMGSKTGNAGSVNGMIVSSGSGYNDGWRLTVYDWKTRQPSIELGQAKGAFSVRANDSLSAGFWNHLAATWDGVRVRIYINGMLSAERPYAGSAVAPKASLRLGFSGFGVGSLRLAADELAVFETALSPEEVAALSLVGQPLPESLKPLVRRAQEEAAAGGRESAGLAYLAFAGAEGAPAVWKMWAELAAVRFAKARKGASAAACAGLFENAAAPAHLRGQAAELLVQICRQGGGGELPSRVLALLPEALELDAEMQRTFGLALGASFAREGNAGGASRVYEQLLTASGASPLDTADVRQRYAQALRQTGSWDGARRQYLAIVADHLAPSFQRGLAALAVGQTWQQEGKLAEAAAAFQTAAAMADQAPHIKGEAEACAAECANLLAGKPACDPETHRQRLRELPVPAVEYVVSPKGSDANPGTLAKPFATLERARDAVRKRKASGALPQGGATVYLRGGRYAVTNTFELTAADSGCFGAPVVYRAWQDEKPVFDGGFRVRGFAKVKAPAALSRLPQESRGQVRVADLKAQGFTALDEQKSYGYGLNNTTVRELYQDGAPLQIARWPNGGSLKIAEVLDVTNRVFACKTERMARWSTASDLMANGYWVHLWAGCTVPVASIDPAAGTFTLREKPGYGMAKDRPFYVLNLLEEIDCPGEWYLDRADGKLYVWPVKHPWFSEIVLSRWNRPFIHATHVQEVVLQGLTFEYGQQHAVVMESCVNAVVARCVIRCMGGTALTVEQGASIKIYGNVLHTLGHTGMHVSGGNRKNLTSGQIVIENNEVGNVGRCSRTYNPALLLEGCGAHVTHNRFHHVPSSAMRIEGNDHLIEYNQVDHVVQESDDQGGIDMWGNPTYRGVVIRFNRWQDIGGGDVPCGQAGIRFDDAISGMVVYGNLFERTSNGHFGGVQIHGGQFNCIDNNVFVGCRYGVSFSPWGKKRWEEYLARAGVKNQLYNDVDINLLPYCKRYPELKGLMSNVDINSISRNVFVGCEEALLRAPKGTDAWDNQTFSVQPDLKAVSARTTLRPLPLDEIGLYDDPARATE